MKLILFKKTTFNSKNHFKSEKPKKVTVFSVLGIECYRSEEFDSLDYFDK